VLQCLHVEDMLFIVLQCLHVEDMQLIVLHCAHLEDSCYLVLQTWIRITNIYPIVEYILILHYNHNKHFHMA